MPRIFFPRKSALNFKQLPVRQTKIITSLLLAALATTGLAGGTIAGIVSARGAPETAEAGGDGAYQSRRYKFAERMDYDHLTDFVIYVDESLANMIPPGTTPVAVTTQRNAVFDPHVLPIAVGTTVKWPNEDDIYHNVFSISDPKEFNLGLYHQERVPVITFDRPGRVDVFCAIHSQMHCIILVLPNPFFAKADANHRFVIKDVPAGTYKLRAWHERLPSLVKEVIVPAEGEVRVDFTLGLAELPKY
jgi:plastocyanin